MRVTLPIVAGLVGTTLLVTIAIAVAVKRLRRRILEHNLNVEESFPKWLVPCSRNAGEIARRYFKLLKNRYFFPYTLS